MRLPCGGRASSKIVVAKSLYQVPAFALGFQNAHLADDGHGLGCDLVGECFGEPRLNVGTRFAGRGKVIVSWPFSRLRSFRDEFA